METVTCRLLPYRTANGAGNMAADEAMLHAAATGVASLRFYGWCEPTLSLGYFQPASARLADPRLTELPWVRRATGGAALVHHHELTYALALPPGMPWQGKEPWMSRMHGVIQHALESVAVGDTRSARTEVHAAGAILCFQRVTLGDLLCRDTKIVGSAQRRQRQGLLQHGAVLLRKSRHAPQLPGLLDLTGVDIDVHQLAAAIVDAMKSETGWHFFSGDWTASERQSIDATATTKYTSTAWNGRR